MFTIEDYAEQVQFELDEFEAHLLAHLLEEVPEDLELPTEESQVVLDVGLLDYLKITRDVANS